MASPNWIGLLKESFSEWQKDKAPRLGAALAYYSLFSLAPLLIIAMAVAGFLFDAERVQRGLLDQIRNLIGTTGADAVQMLLQNAHRPAAGIVATVIGVISLVAAATGVFTELQDALNTIWGLEPKPRQSLWQTIRERFLSFTMVLGIGFLLLVSLALSALSSGMVAFLTGQAHPLAGLLAEGLNLIVSFAVVTLLFAMIYKILPDTQIEWRDVWMGALLTAALFTIGKFVIGRYLGISSVSSSYGAAGSLLVVLLWVYYSAQILFFGAEFTKVYAKQHGSWAGQQAVVSERTGTGESVPGAPPAQSIVSEGR